MSPLDRGALIQRFEVDAATELSLARLRFVAAGLASLGAVAMLLSSLPFVIMLVAVLSLLVSLGWMAKARSTEKRARSPQDHFLAVHAAGLDLADGPSRTWVMWASVTQIDVDEERLDIVVERADGEPLRLEPRYPGVEIHDLMHTLRNAWLKQNDL